MERYLFWIILGLFLIVGLLVAFNTNVVPIIDEKGNVIGKSTCGAGGCHTCICTSGGCTQYTKTFSRGMPDCD